MRCEQVREQIPAYILGALSEKERVQLEHHLLDCPDCTAEVRQGLETVGAFAAVLPEHAPSPALKDMLFRSLPSRVTPEPLHTEQFQPVFTLRRLWLPVTAAAMAVMLVALVGNTIFLQSRVADLEEQALALPLMQAQIERNEQVLSRNEQLLDTVEDSNADLVNLVQQQRGLLYWLFTPDVQRTVVEPTPNGKGYGMLISRPDSSVAILVLSGVPELPDGQSYQVWLSKDGQSAWAGSFKPDESGWAQEAVRATNGRVLDFDGLWISASNSVGSRTNVLNASLKK